MEKADNPKAESRPYLIQMFQELEPLSIAFASITSGQAPRKCSRKSQQINFLTSVPVSSHYHSAAVLPASTGLPKDRTRDRAA